MQIPIEYREINEKAHDFFNEEIARASNAMQVGLEGTGDLTEYEASMKRLHSYSNFARWLFAGDAEYPGPFTSALLFPKLMTFRQYLLHTKGKDGWKRPEMIDCVMNWENSRVNKVAKYKYQIFAWTMRNWIKMERERKPVNRSGQQHANVASSPKNVPQ